MWTECHPPSRRNYSRFSPPTSLSLYLINESFTVTRISRTWVVPLLLGTPDEFVLGIAKRKWVLFFKYFVCIPLFIFIITFIISYHISSNKAFIYNNYVVVCNSILYFRYCLFNNSPMCYLLYVCMYFIIFLFWIFFHLYYASISLMFHVSNHASMK